MYAFYILTLPPTKSTLFPYTTLFPISCDVVIEAVVEELEPKVEILRTAGDAAAEADLASTTSSLPLDELGSRGGHPERDRKSTRLNSSHPSISYAVFCLTKKKQTTSPN